MPTNHNFNPDFDAQMPLDDEKLWEMLSLYVDGEANPAEAALVEEMLNSDPAYVRDFEFLMQTSRAVHTWEEVAPPVGLRDAIYAQTVRRATLFGRLRAAWGGITAPSFGRLASVGGAFAAAALFALVAWPHLHSTPNGVPANISPSNTVAATQPHQLVLPSYTVVPNTPSRNLEHPQVKPSVKLDAPTKLVKAETPGTKIAPKSAMIVKPNAVRPAVVVKAHLPVNHYLPKGSVPAPESGPITGYAYDKKMDDAAVHRLTPTVKPVATNDFGPTVAANDDTVSAPTPGHTTETPTASAAGNSENGTGTPTQPTPQPQPKRTVRTGVLPPESRQVLAAAVIRQTAPPKNYGLDRNVAENIQRHELTFDVIKSSF